LPHEQFSPHGNVSASYDPDDNILYLNLTGPFNLEFMQAYENKVAPLRSQINKPYWVSLVNVYGLALAPLPSIAYARNIIDNAMTGGLVATAVVFHSKDAKSTIERFWHKMYAKTPLSYRFFDNQDEAKQWLQTESGKFALSSEHKTNSTKARLN